MIVNLKTIILDGNKYAGVLSANHEVGMLRFFLSVALVPAPKTHP